jgi:hypothetical protein
MKGQPDSELRSICEALHAPLADLDRSPVARRIGRLAHARGLFLFDYEARLQLELPEHWLPAGRPDLEVTGEPPTWHRGLLSESKYLSFRHDLMLGSLHAGHRAKWSAHELCHGLVGFAWRPDASVLFMALAARLAEVLPVAVWYFLDESGLVRCPRHAHQLEVGPGFCRRCEEVQASREVKDPDRDFVLRGRTFIQTELASIRRALRDGVADYNPHGAVDLMTDGLAYAAAHLPRLRSPETASVMAHLFADDASGRFDTLEAMLAHVEALGEDLCAAALGEERALPSVVMARDRFIAQDLAARFAQVAAETEGECGAGLLDLVARLGAGAPITAAVAGYESLFEDFELPEPGDLFAVGYRLGDLGLARDQIADGLMSACGSSIERLRFSGTFESHLDTFLERLAPSRRPLSRRFFDHVRGAIDPETRGLMALEVAITDAEPPDPAELALGFDAVDLRDGDTLTLARGVELVRCGFDAGGLLMKGEADASGPHDFLVRRDAGDQVGLVALTAKLADQLGAGLPAHEVFASIEGRSPDRELAALVEEQLLVPRRHALTTEG